MTPDEIKEYNTEAITSFSGMFFCVIAYVLFLIGLCVSVLFGVPMGTIASAIAVLALMLFWSIFIATNKKFKTRA